MTLNPARLVRIRDWAATLPPRPLPRTVTPFNGEYHLDYVKRLAAANHLEFLLLAQSLHPPGPPPLDHTATKLPVRRLAALAGQPDGRIARLHWPDAGVYLRDIAGFYRGLRPACRRCAACRGVHDPILCKLPDDHTVCRRHRLWIGPGVRTLDDQHDLRPFPEYLRAQRRHQHLSRSAYPHSVTAALRQITKAVRQEIIADGLWELAQQRLRHLAPALWPHLSPAASRFVRAEHIHDRAVTVGVYPEVIERAQSAVRPSNSPRPGR
ncbi:MULTISPECIES: hypothetical protein [unclassified Pseudonocardia]|uniref:hypothetical protein n=1 Tax=unclassified Pseudonocardia TaxID=2619320 RepID=UPI000760DC60|nr:MULTISPECIES: hypothetical protein [unclassified Pseudonocardia]